MKRVLLGLIALGSIAASSPAAAQTPRFSLGVGGVMPSGDYGTLDNVGWNLLGALEIGLPKSPIGVRADFIYGQTSHGDLFPTGSTTLSGVSADVVYISCAGASDQVVCVGGAWVTTTSVSMMHLRRSRRTMREPAYRSVLGR